VSRTIFNDDFSPQSVGQSACSNKWRLKQYILFIFILFDHTRTCILYRLVVWQTNVHGTQSNNIVSHYWLLWAPAQRKRATMLYFANVFLFILFLWPPYSPALVNGGSRKFYTWWILSVIREDSSWIFSWSPLNYRVGQKVTKFGVFSDRTRKLSALTPERGRILQFWKKTC